MKFSFLLLCIASFFMASAQDREEDSLIRKALDGGFLKTAHGQYKIYQKDSAQHKAPIESVNAARVIFISYYDKADTARAILQALKHGMKPEQLAARYRLELHDDWDYAYVLEPLFVKQYVNKVCFPSHILLSREDLVFENRQNLAASKQIKANTFFYELDDKEIRVIYFLEPYQKHALPGFMNEAFQYYSILTKSTEPLYRQMFRLPGDTASADSKYISNAWDNFPGQPARPKDPGSKDSLAQQVYKNQKQAYDKAFGDWEKAREQAFDSRLQTDPVLKKAYNNYSSFLQKYPVSVRNPAGRLLAERLNLTNRITPRYPRRRNVMYYGVYDQFIDTAITSNDYPLFARSFFYLPAYKYEQKLDSLKTIFYQSRRQMYLGALSAVLLKSPGLFQKQAGGSSRVLSDGEKLQVMQTIETWLASKPQDELMLYYMGSVYSDLADDLRSPKDDIDYEQTLKAYFKSQKAVYYWLFDEEPEAN